MAPRRIHIIGGPGSGKSVTARRLATAYGIPVTDLDGLFWEPTAHRYGSRAEPEERARAPARVLESPSWIIEGVYHSWVRRCFEEADLILVMTAPVWLRDWRIGVRFLKRKLGLVESKRESVGDLWKLLRWNHRYDGDDLRAARRTVRELGRSVVECRGVDDALRATAAASW
jgi:adenylate kinase family enzyme